MGAVNPLPQWQYFNSTIEKQFLYEHDPLLHPPLNVYEVLNTIFECIQPLKFYIILTSCTPATLFICAYMCVWYIVSLIISARKVMSYIHNHRASLPLSWVWCLGFASFTQSVSLFLSLLNAILSSRTLLFSHCDIACTQCSWLQP